MNSETHKITINKLKKLILQLSAESRISIDMSLKFLDHINSKQLLPSDAQKVLISLTTLALTKDEIEKMLTHFLERKITVVDREEDSTLSIEDTIHHKPDLVELDKAIEKERVSRQFDYRSYVYNYLLTIINAIDDSSIHTHFVKIKSEVPEITESEFRKILKRVIQDNKAMDLPYEGLTKELENTLDITPGVQIEELPAFSSDYVHLIKDPAAYILDNVKNLTLTKLLSVDDEKYYGKMLTSSNPIKRAEAKQKFTLANLKLVMYVVRQFTRHDDDLINLFDEGFLGLQKAIQKFDYTKNFRFSTYAIWWIKRAILKSLQNTSKTIRIPAHLISILFKLIKLQDTLKKEKNVERITKEMLKHQAKIRLNIDEKRFKILYPLMINQVQLDELTTEKIDELDSKYSMDSQNDTIAEIERGELNKTIEKLLEQLLTTKEHQVIQRRFGLINGKDKMTLQAIADEFGVSKERIRQIEQSAKLKLKSDYVQKTLETYFATIKQQR